MFRCLQPLYLLLLRAGVAELPGGFVGRGPVPEVATCHRVTPRPQNERQWPPVGDNRVEVAKVATQGRGNLQHPTCAPRTSCHAPPRDRQRPNADGRDQGLGHHCHTPHLPPLDQRRQAGQGEGQSAQATIGAAEVAGRGRGTGLKIARENGRGYTRVLGELKNLGVKVSRLAVVNIPKANGLDTGPKRGPGTWSKFLARHAATLRASDFFSVKA
jgi:hypothetical protein